MNNNHNKYLFINIKISSLFHSLLSPYFVAKYIPRFLKSEINLNICSRFVFYRTETKLRQWIMLFTEVSAVYRENHARPMRALYGQNSSRIVKQVVHTKTVCFKGLDIRNFLS
jgi:hypothetical protein